MLSQARSGSNRRDFIETVGLVGASLAAANVAKGGRDADSIATNAASWLGAMSGGNGWPKSWLQTVQDANLWKMNFRGMAEDLILKGLENSTVRL